MIKKTSGLFFTISGLLTLLSCVNEDKWRCQKYTDYLNHEVYGRLEKKYIDYSNHARQALVLRLYNNIGTDIDATLMVNGLYDTIKIGDEIFKKKGSTLTVIKRGDLTIELTVDKSDWCTEDIQSDKK